ncbi:polysaccharide pyruvyl transferase CsaB [Cellulosilyticum sp. I15G10I2]|uniref:polysaccharide pyruvyl transferase CsaB n=1 Tax=Cellulosilyticum sp. I15G10I2 TaxID=1892843 RepID=UPI00085C0DBA|nr:polysaccharide pyruvyl transferase CsaB [Cellulosilyticum sp. I15G10I2]
MGNSNKIVISGYYGFDNIGDEAVLSAILSLLRASIKDTDITVLSNNPEKTKALYDVETVNRWDIKAIIKAIKACDLLISGGGSLLQDITSQKTVPYYLGIVKIALWHKKRVVFYSQGIGPINHKWNKWFIKKVANQVDQIFVREYHSKKVLEAIGVKKPIIVAADPVLGIKPSEHVYKYVKDLLGVEKAVGVYIRPWQDESAIIDCLEKALQYVIQEGYKVYLIPMHYAQDREVAHKLRARLKEHAIVIDKMLTIDEVVSYTASFEFIIGMRLHSLIMAAAMQTPMIGLAYDPKVTDFMKDMQVPYCIDVAHINPDKLIHMIQKLISSQSEQRKHLKVMHEIQVKKVNLPVEYIKGQLL